MQAPIDSTGAGLCSYIPTSRLDTDEADMDLVRATVTDLLFNSEFKSILVVSRIPGCVAQIARPRLGRLLYSDLPDLVEYTDHSGQTCYRVRRVSPTTPEACDLEQDCLVFHCNVTDEAQLEGWKQYVETIKDEGWMGLRVIVPAAMIPFWHRSLGGGVETAEEAEDVMAAEEEEAVTPAPAPPPVGGYAYPAEAGAVSKEPNPQEEILRKVLTMTLKDFNALEPKERETVFGIRAQYNVQFTE